MESLNEANTFLLSGKSIHVTYTSTGITGQPTFSYRDNRLSLSFIGEGIRLQDTEVGQLVTVTLEAADDGNIVTFSLALPIVTIPRGPGIRIKVPGLTVTNPSTFTGPPPGPRKLYSIVSMKGTAQFFQF